MNEIKSTEMTKEEKVIQSIDEKMINMFSSMNRKQKREFCKKNGISYKEMFRPVTKEESERLSVVFNNKGDVYAHTNRVGGES
jgi:hypothetical protein